MILDEYNSLPEDLKLDARLAITLGMVGIIYIPKYDPCQSIWVRGEYLGFDKNWKPRQDPAILWGLTGERIDLLHEHMLGNWSCGLDRYQWVSGKTKEEAVIKAYCEADPNGHWAKWCKENEVAV